MAIRQRLEQTADPNLFNGIERRDMKLNINTLDNYSLSEIKRIRTNLERNTKYSKYLKETDKEPTLVKKF